MRVSTGCLMYRYIVNILPIRNLWGVTLQPRVHFINSKCVMTSITFTKSGVKRVLIRSTFIALEVPNQRLIIISFKPHLIGAPIIIGCLITVEHVDLRQWRLLLTGYRAFLPLRIESTPLIKAARESIHLEYALVFKLCF